ncbi:MAG: glycerophosphodiester phosphodiesterase [Streptococcaceae bacterium]|jgi:glycerophosphoryl diester phosphodiesterase|nr:glycerophosphodiester phosphodiesterase [Streptococcaceae bacterium]
MTKVFAHRGSSSNLPENSWSAFEEAIRVGADGIETDVHLSKDGHLVIMHDEKVDRTTDGSGWIKDMTLSELQELDIGEGQPVLTLSELLTRLTSIDYKGTLNLEVKTDKIHYSGIEALISQQMTARKWPFTYVYSSFYYKSLVRLKEMEVFSETALLIGKRFYQLIRGEFSKSIDTLHPHYNYLPFLSHLSKRSRVWTVNDPQKIEKCLKHGYDVISNFPEIALKIKKELNQ